MEETLLSRRLVAVWFADIVGYSARAAEDETSALRLVEILQTFSRETVRRYGGRVVKFIGDAVLAEFPSTDLAVRAAVALNIQYADKSITSGGVHRLRIGVHVGDVAVGADGDLYGDAVNVAARIQEAAEPGQVVLSRDVWQQLRSRRDFRFQSLGDRSLKGIAPATLYVVTLEENAAKSTPPMVITCGRTASTDNSKTSLRSRTRSLTASLPAWASRYLTGGTPVAHVVDPQRAGVRVLSPRAEAVPEVDSPKHRVCSADVRASDQARSRFRCRLGRPGHRSRAPL